MRKGKGETAKSGHSSFPPSPLLLSFVLGTMTPAASEPALSEVEGTEARKRNIFAETTILYACTAAVMNWKNAGSRPARAAYIGMGIFT